MSSTVLTEPYRCRRGYRCGDREPVLDQDGYPIQGEWVGAQLPTHDGLCRVCISAVSSALSHLELDVTMDLDDLIGRLPDGSTLESTRIALSAPGSVPPIRLEIEALRALIVHEACAWAGSVADAVRLEWTVPPDYGARIKRLPRAADLLRHQLSTFLSLGETEHRARSLTARRCDGHDEQIATVFGDDIWTTRTGLEGAVLLLELHEMAWSLADRADRSEPLFMPCTACCYMTMRHMPGEDEVWCTHCRDRRSWEDYTVLREYTARAHAAA